MACVREINRIEELSEYRSVWGTLLAETKGASFFQSLEWLEAYWRHFGAGQKLRTLVVGADEDRPLGILPLVVRTERTRVGHVRVATYPLQDWGSFYGPVGGHPAETIRAGLEHVGRTRRDWDLIELRWLGGPGTETAETEQAMRQAGLQAYRTRWEPYGNRRTRVCGQQRQSHRPARGASVTAKRKECFRRHVGGLSGFAAEGVAAELAAVRTEARPTGRFVADTLSAPRCGGRRRRSTLGPVRCVRADCPAKLAGIGRQRHHAFARIGAALLARGTRGCRRGWGRRSALVDSRRKSGSVYVQLPLPRLCVRIACGLRRPAVARRRWNAAMGPLHPRAFRFWRLPVRSRRRLTGVQASLCHRHGRHLALQPLSPHRATRAVVAGEAVGRRTLLGVHRGRPRSGWHGRHAMSVRGWEESTACNV
jgi:hypothetical protein